MKAILAGVFVGVFFGALGYEIINRTNPQMVESIRRKVSNEVDRAMGKGDESVDEEPDEFDDLDDMDIDFEPQPSQA
jgi:hypothetical protein